MLGRGLMGRGGQARVAFSSAAAARDEKCLPRVREVIELFAGMLVIGDGAHGHFELDRFALVSGAIAAFPVPAALRFVFGVETVAEQRVGVLARHHSDVAAAAAIAAAGTAARDILLAPERQTAVAAVARLYVDFGFVDEHRDPPDLPGTK